MPHRLVIVAIALAVGSPALAAREGSPAIEHEPLRCVVAGTHPWIQARVVGAAGVQVHFRRPGSSDWYIVRLSDEADGWAGALPRPDRTVPSLVYLVEATDASARSSRTPEHTVRVVAEEAACGTDGVGPSVPEAAVTVQAPKGRPPLPKGFGVGGPEAEGGPKVGVFNMSPRTALVAALGVGAAAVAGAAAAARHEPTLNTIALVSATPPNLSVVSLSSMALSVHLRVTSKTDIGAGSVVVSLHESGAPAPCVTLWAPHPGIQAGRPQEVVVDRVLFVTCPAPFATQGAQATVRGPGETDVFSAPLSLGYGFSP